MNRALVERVEFPPIVGFKDTARKTTPNVSGTFDLTQAVPSLPTFRTIREKLAQALLDDTQVSFYTDVPGILPLRQRIAETHALRGAFSEKHVVVTAGANHAMMTAMMLYFQAGDSVLLPEPFYFNHDMALKMLDMKPVYFSLKEENGFRLDAREMIASLEKSAAAGTKIRGVLLVTPNNPTGARYPANEIATLLAWTAPRGIEVIVDETYARYDEHHLNDKNLAVFVGKGLSLIGSFSKTYSLTGYRVGYLVCGDSAMTQVLKVQDTSIICAPHVSQLAALYGQQYCEPELVEQLSKIQELTALVQAHGKDLKHFRLTSAGCFFAYLRHPFQGHTCEEATLELYQETGILGLPGTVFGPSQASFIRLAFCNLGKADLAVAFERLREFDKKF